MGFGGRMNIAGKIAVGKQNTFGRTGGAGGVDQAGNVVGFRINGRNRVIQADTFQFGHGALPLSVDENDVIQGLDLVGPVFHLG